MAMAHHISTPVSHISQVLNGKSQLSLEQAESINDFLGHTSDESQFFLLLVQIGRAGTRALKNRLSQQAEQILEKRLVLKDRLGVTQPLSKENQAIFYSSWLYGAIHVMLTIPQFQSKESISDYLGISLKRTAEILEFLVSIELAIPLENGRFGVGTSRIHLGSDSPMISKFHTNWRMQAIRSLDKEDGKSDLHYSSVITISDEDFKKIKNLLVKYIEEIKLIVKNSPSQKLHSFCLDFFHVNGKN
ncbi:MAG: hypothetical protein A4S09_01080 [Proteobacteria bacterium SG_bin7]|nr:MAG: hypothetical protein A4S09_01080 [Proteobacteria bacterium SG_bin7]